MTPAARSAARGAARGPAPDEAPPAVVRRQRADRTARGGAAETEAAFRAALDLPPLPDTAAAHTYPGSRMRRLVWLVHARCAARGAGLTLPEIREAFARAGVPDAATITGEVVRAVASGRLDRVGQRNHYRYVPPGFAESGAARLTARSDGEILADAVRAACTRLGARASTAHVRCELRLQGWSLARPRPGAVCDHLDTLAGVAERPRRRPGARQPTGARHAVRPGAGRKHPPALTRVAVPSVRGYAAWTWAPADQPALPASVPAVTGPIDAVVAVADELLAAVGRPMTLAELWLHVRRLAPSHPAAVFLGPDAAPPGEGGPRLLFRVLRRALNPAPARPPVAAGRTLVAVNTPFTAAGGPRRRYTVVDRAGGPEPGRRPEGEVPARGRRAGRHGGSVPTSAGAAAYLDDLLDTLAPDEERRTLRRTEATLIGRDAEVLAPWIAYRRAAAADVLRAALEAAPPDAVVASGDVHAGDPAEAAGRNVWAAWLRAAATHADGADRHLLRLAESDGRRTAGARTHALELRRRIARRGAAADAVAALLRDGPPCGPPLRDTPGGDGKTPGAADPAAAGPTLHERLAGGRMPVRALAAWVAAYAGDPDTPAWMPAAGRADHGRRRATRAVWYATTVYLVRACRRFPAPDAPAIRAARRGGPLENPGLQGTQLRGGAGGPPAGETRDRRNRYTYSRVDRPEALVAAAAVQDDPWTAALLRRAYELLGPTARDAAPLAGCLAQVGSDDDISPGFRRRLVVAGGLLGAPATAAAAERLVADALAAGDPAEADLDVRAAALAAALLGADALDALTRGPAFAALGFDARAVAAGLDERAAKVRRRARAGLSFSVGAP